MQQTWLKYRHIIILSLGTVIVLLLLYFLRTVVLPFVLGLVLANLLLPVVAWMEERLPRKDKWRQAKRTLSVTVIFLVGFGLFSLFCFYVGSAIVSSLTALIDRAPEYTVTALIDSLFAPIKSIVPVRLQPQVQDFLVSLGTTMGDTVKGVFHSGTTLIPTTLGFLISFFSLPFFLFYVLKDWRKLRIGFLRGLPQWAGTHTANVVAIAGKVLGKFLQAQALLGLIVGTMDYIGLVVLQAPLAPVLALLGGATEMIPLIGPWIGTLTALFVTLAFAPDRAIWVAVWFVGVQLLENNLLVPRIQGGKMEVHPAIAMVLLAMGTFFAGFWGLLLVMPIAGTIIQVYKYAQSTVKQPQMEFRGLQNIR